MTDQLVVTIQLDMTPEDFGALVNVCAKWAGQGWDSPAHLGRFEHAVKKYDAPPSYAWKNAYWVDNDWSHVMILRAFLVGQGASYEVLWDMAGGAEIRDDVFEGEYVILTDYDLPDRAPQEG